MAVLDVDFLIQTLPMAALLLGLVAGWNLSRSEPGMSSGRTDGFFRGTTKPLRVAAGAFGGASVGFSLRLLGEYLNMTPLVYLAVAIVGVSIGVGGGAIIRGPRG